MSILFVASAVLKQHAAQHSDAKCLQPRNGINAHYRAYEASVPQQPHGQRKQQPDPRYQHRQSNGAQHRANNFIHVILQLNVKELRQQTHQSRY